jgi:replication factor C subunit 3/5
MSESIPWIEKYRPTNFNDIVLDPINRAIFENILKNEYIPNLLFYGPPGTGKTTTIINLINNYQEKTNEKYKENIIHLNASDERGIDIIRNQIQQFVKSYNFFNKGLKFVILDEVDYMTKNAQQALKYLIQISGKNVRYCLICNYISKIDSSLINEFICIRFNQLPKQEIYTFINNIRREEQLELSDKFIDGLISNYGSDIRSMINFIQLNQSYSNEEPKLLNDLVWTRILELIKTSTIQETNKYMHSISVDYNIDKKTVLYNFCYYLIRSRCDLITPELLSTFELIIHDNNSDIVHNIEFLYESVKLN